MSNWTKLRIAVGKAILPDAAPEPGPHKSSSSTKVNDRTFQYVQDQRNLTGTECRDYYPLNFRQPRRGTHVRYISLDPSIPNPLILCVCELLIVTCDPLKSESTKSHRLWQSTKNATQQWTVQIDNSNRKTAESTSIDAIETSYWRWKTDNVAIAVDTHSEGLWKAEEAGLARCCRAQGVAYSKGQACLFDNGNGF